MTEIKEKVVEKLIKEQFKDASMKLSPDAIKLSQEMMHLFVAEVMNRATEAAQASESGVVDTVHVQKVLPQVMLDFF